MIVLNLRFSGEMCQLQMTSDKNGKACEELNEAYRELVRKNSPIEMLRNFNIFDIYFDAKELKVIFFLDATGRNEPKRSQAHKRYKDAFSNLKKQLEDNSEGKVAIAGFGSI